MKKTHFFSPIIFTAIILFLVPSCKKDEPATNPVLSTSSVTNITVSTATSGGNITSDGGAKITARGVCWGPTANPTTSDSKTVDGDGTGQFVSDITGINPGSTYYVRAYATNSVGTSYGNEITFKSYDIMDIDGNGYSIVTIGTQIWMAGDLKTTKYNDGSAIPNVTNNSEWISLATGAYCLYNNDIINKTLYGALYNWFSVSSGNLCPDGWHVPSDSEWFTLIDFLGGEAVAGGKLKQSGQSTWLSPNTGATNESGFTALPSGDRIGADGSFYNLGGFAIYWTSDESSFSQAINRVLESNNTNFRIGYDNKTAGFSVRCIKDM